MIPATPVRSSFVGLVLCHYKFIDKADMGKIEEAVIKENYASNSEDYKKYLITIRKEKNLNFYDERESVELIDSKSLNKIIFLKKIFE